MEKPQITVLVERYRQFLRDVYDMGDDDTLGWHLYNRAMREQPKLREHRMWAKSINVRRVSDKEFMRRQDIVTPYQRLITIRGMLCETLEEVLSFIPNGRTNLTDIGFGFGELDTFLVREKLLGSGHLIAVDISRVMYESATEDAKRAGVEVDFRIASATDLHDIPSNSQQAVLMHELLHWVRDWQAALAEAVRILAKAGRLMLTWHPNMAAERNDLTPRKAQRFLKGERLRIVEIGFYPKGVTEGYGIKAIKRT